MSARYVARHSRAGLAPLSQLQILWMLEKAQKKADDIWCAGNDAVIDEATKGSSHLRQTPLLFPYDCCRIEKCYLYNPTCQQSVNMEAWSYKYTCGTGRGKVVGVENSGKDANKENSVDG